LKTRITGLKSADNAWTQTLRDTLDPDTVNGKLAGDRTFKTNQQWVAPTHGGSKEAAPKWRWYGVLFMLAPFRAPFGMLSGKQEAVSLRVGLCLHQRMPQSLRENCVANCVAGSHPV
jgi:hypothetical protein